MSTNIDFKRIDETIQKLVDNGVLVKRETPSSKSIMFRHTEHDTNVLLDDSDEIIRPAKWVDNNHIKIDGLIVELPPTTGPKITRK